MPNQLSNFRTKNWIEINDQSRNTYVIIVMHTYLLKAE